jgi:hypothetical protein
LNSENKSRTLPAYLQEEQMTAALRIAEKKVTFATEQLAFRFDADRKPIFPGEQPAPITIKNSNPRAKSRSASKERGGSGSSKRKSRSPGLHQNSGKSSTGRKQKKALVHATSHSF